MILQAWQAIPATVASVEVHREPIAPGTEDLALWQGRVQFAEAIAANRYRLLIEEYELISTDAPARGAAPGPGRLVFAETVTIDATLADSPENRSP